MRAIGFMLLAMSAGAWGAYLSARHGVTFLDLLLLAATTVIGGVLAARETP